VTNEGRTKMMNSKIAEVFGARWHMKERRYRQPLSNQRGCLGEIWGAASVSGWMPAARLIGCPFARPRLGVDSRLAWHAPPLGMRIHHENCKLSESITSSHSR
jgi:hypothetical protein